MNDLKGVTTNLHSLTIKLIVELEKLMKTLLDS